MMATKIVLRKDGTAEGVYNDRWLPIMEALGPIEINRATNVEWDPSRKEWIATHLKTDIIIAAGRNRKDVISAEVKFLEEQLR